MLEFILAVVLTELLVELVVKSEIFKPLRQALGRWDWIKKLVNCGYCFSIWAAIAVVFLTDIPYPLTGNRWLNLGLTALVIHRLSNYLHNFNDKFFDKYYDVRYVNTEK